MSAELTELIDDHSPEAGPDPQRLKAYTSELTARMHATLGPLDESEKAQLAEMEATIAGAAHWTRKARCLFEIEQNGLWRGGGHRNFRGYLLARRDQMAGWPTRQYSQKIVRNWLARVGEAQAFASVDLAVITAGEDDECLELEPSPVLALDTRSVVDRLKERLCNSDDSPLEQANSYRQLARVLADAATDLNRQALNLEVSCKA